MRRLGISLAPPRVDVILSHTPPLEALLPV